MYFSTISRVMEIVHAFEWAFSGKQSLLAANEEPYFTL